MTKIGFIGTGVMGTSIGQHLLEAGHTLAVFNRTKSKTDQLVKLGATYNATPKEVTLNSDVIFSMVGYPQDVEKIYYGAEGIFSADVTGKYLVDMTTSTPSLAIKIEKKAQELGAKSLDAPVSGGDIGAQKGTLTTMVGGETETYQELLPLFKVFSSKVNLQGGPGAGQHTKMANQIMIAGTMTGMTELLVYAQHAGLDVEKVLDTVGGGSAANWSLTNYAPRILQQDYSAGFFVKHFIKDLGIALDEAKKMKVQLPATEQAKKMYDELAHLGFENDGTQALIKLWWNKGIYEN
ncbi:NAD(P)-dependent oxidoreductase [Vagococcus entomophilus]|uniref:Oxidoreductase n=1 Tax=Vagococcus entomophilus TaxID=1160095 RepID=A0A430AIX8_9ENTE|nr:NAD(P)-dependent oxidoreductase [Vagococcus entomophilus]RSU08069.1 oxidoreductase [Vagococcus entomophilus]